MLANRPEEFISPLLKSGPAAIGAVLEALPSAVAFWSPDRHFCIFNYQAKQLIGFSDRDFSENASLWINKIDPRDRDLVSSAWKKLKGGEKMVSCDYRFSPKGEEKEIWIRDVSVSYQNPPGEVKSIISNYTDISDLKISKQNSQRGKTSEPVVEVISALVHEIQNNLHVISMGLDLLRLDLGRPLESQHILNGIERVNNSILELREYFLPTQSQFSAEKAEIILEEVVQQMEKELRRQGVSIRISHRGPLPLVRLDRDQFRSALQRVIEFSRALLPHGGELEVEAGLQVIDGQRYVELQVASSSATSLAVEEKDVFRPFLRVNNRQIGLSLTLTRDILSRAQGKISFQKENPRRGLFTILLRVSST